MLNINEKITVKVIKSIMISTQLLYVMWTDHHNTGCAYTYLYQCTYLYFGTDKYMHSLLMMSRLDFW